MKKPKQTKTYCPKCKKHTLHTIVQTKTGTPSGLKRGSKVRMKRRGKGIGKGNLGSISRGAMSKWKRYGVKSSKRVNLKLTCSECKKTYLKIQPRAKKIESK